jgi:hypothetical protein
MANKKTKQDVVDIFAYLKTLNWQHLMAKVWGRATP